MENKLIDLNFIQNEFKEWFGITPDIFKFNTEEAKLLIEFNLHDYDYSYELRKGAVIKRKLDNFNIDFDTLKDLDKFMKTLLEKIFVADDTGQMTIYETAERRALYADQ